jgi:uncharacterized protein YecT (DUF1311 family)
MSVRIIFALTAAFTLIGPSNAQAGGRDGHELRRCLSAADRLSDEKAHLGARYQCFRDQLDRDNKTLTQTYDRIFSDISNKAGALRSKGQNSAAFVVELERENLMSNQLAWIIDGRDAPCRLMSETFQHGGNGNDDQKTTNTICQSAMTQSRSEYLSLIYDRVYDRED